MQPLSQHAPPGYSLVVRRLNKGHAEKPKTAKQFGHLLLETASPGLALASGLSGPCSWKWPLQALLLRVASPGLALASGLSGTCSCTMPLQSDSTPFTTNVLLDPEQTDNFPQHAPPGYGVVTRRWHQQRACGKAENRPFRRKSWGCGVGDSGIWMENSRRGIFRKTVYMSSKCGSKDECRSHQSQDWKAP